MGIPWIGGSPQMKFTVQLVAWTDNGQEETMQEVAMLEKESERVEHLGLTLAEAKQLLKRLQHYLVERQTTSYLVARARCEACGRALLVKEQLTRTIRTLFGTVVLTSPRLYHCRCRARTATTFRPLRALLPDSTTPELLFLETKWASLISYGLTTRVLKDFLPLDETLTVTTVQNHTLAIAQRCEEELGEEQQGAVDGCPGDPGPSSRPKGPVAVGLDGGYVRHWEQKQHHFEVIVGKSLPPAGPAKCFGFVQTYDTNPQQRLCAVLQSQGVPDPQPLTFLSDGGETVRDLPVALYPRATHLLDWFHLAMRVTVLGQYSKGVIRLNQEVGEVVQKKLESVKWSLWHGKVDKTLDRLRDLDLLIDHFADSYPRFPQLKKAVQEFHTYIVNNRRFIPNYGRRYRRGERISTGFVESTVNYVISKRFVKRQSMQWTKRGAHLLLQTRVKTLNNELASTFRRWYPALQVEDTALAA
jgi:hypothetical protein